MMNRKARSATVAFLGFVIFIGIVLSGVHIYKWYSEPYTIQEGGLTGSGEISGDFIVNHTQTVSAWINNTRSSPANGTVTVNVVTSENVLVEQVYASPIIIPAGDVWNMPGQNWTPESVGDFKVEIVFEESY